MEWPDLLAHHAADVRGRRRVLGASAAVPFDPAGRLDRVRRILDLRAGKV